MEKGSKDVEAVPSLSKFPTAFPQDEETLNDVGAVPGPSKIPTDFGQDVEAVPGPSKIPTDFGQDVEAVPGPSKIPTDFGQDVETLEDVRAVPGPSKIITDFNLECLQSQETSSNNFRIPGPSVAMAGPSNQPRENDAAVPGPSMFPLVFDNDNNRNIWEWSLKKSLSSIFKTLHQKVTNLFVDREMAHYDRTTQDMWQFGYNIISPIGRGAFGIVYKASLVNDEDKEAAVKCIFKHGFERFIKVLDGAERHSLARFTASGEDLDGKKPATSEIGVYERIVKQHMQLPVREDHRMTSTSS
ncbi:hypothetical protein DNTS_033383 [Danionella cerebrum]|uniref:Protein kinase domain-containing protein n=1 Tax=Danionella cerebrum TaxID=2873325 RepID=A0A553RFQ6_9TELE|nr:hypothetical protein DNTS_033383 [Danionella translucida]